MTPPRTPVMAATATAPVRIADVGGWTDTWFGSPGHVCHLAVGPGVTVRAIRTSAADPAWPVHLQAPDLGADYLVGPSPSAGWEHPAPLRDPLLAHAVGAVLAGADWPVGDGIDLTITSAVPAGASLGTSASVVVATLAALHALVGETTQPSRLAEEAHEVETARAERQAGVQDGWAAACGGAGLMQVDPYPRVIRRTLEIPRASRAALDRQLVTVVFAAHDSSAVHAEVIEALGQSNAAAERTRSALHHLSRLARQAATALERDDLTGWAQILTEATEAQRTLHPGLVGSAHEQAIEVARRHRAVGWKVNGAGGDGGSLTIACPDEDQASGLRDALTGFDPGWRVVDLHLAPGVAVRLGPDA